MPKTVTKGQIAVEDLNYATGTFSRTTSTGGTQTMTSFHFLDAQYFSGANAGAKISAAMTALPSTGGVVIAPFEGAQTIATDVFTSVTKQVSLFLGAGTFSFSVSTTIPANITIYCSAGTVLSPAVSTTLTINGPFFGERSTNLGGSGTITFADGLAPVSVSAIDLVGVAGNACRLWQAPSFNALFRNQGSNQVTYVGVSPKGTIADGTAKAILRVFGTDVVTDSSNWEVVDLEAETQPESSNRVVLTSIVRSSNVVTVTTTTAHTAIVGDSITIAGSTDGGTGTSFNGTFTVATSATTTTLTFAQTGSNGTAGIGAATFGVVRPVYYIKTRLLGTGSHRPFVFQVGGFNVLFIDPTTGSITTAPDNNTAGIAIVDGAGRGDIILGVSGSQIRGLNTARTSTIALLESAGSGTSLPGNTTAGATTAPRNRVDVYSDANNSGVSLQAGSGLFSPAYILRDDSGTIKTQFGVADATNDWVTGSADGDTVIRTASQKLIVTVDAGTSVASQWATTGVLTTSKGINIGTSVAADGSGYKHIRVSTGSINASTTADVSANWSTPFADTNYNVEVSIQGTAAASTNDLRIHHWRYAATPANGIIVTVVNDDAGSAHTSTLHITGIHD